MATTITLRRATPHDAAAVARVCRLAGGGAFDFLYGGLAPGADAESTLAKLCALTGNPYSHTRFTLAESDGVVAGGVNAISIPELMDSEQAILPAMFNELGLSRIAVFRAAVRRIRIGLRIRGRHPDPDTLILSNVAVFPEYTSQGVGTALVRHVLDYAAAEGFPSVSLVVWDTNERAKALYARMGFELVDIAPFKPMRCMPYRARCLMVKGTARV